jgi:predicted PurR-regulated permease PerM
MFNIFNRKKQVVAVTPSIVVFTISLLLFLYFIYQIREIAIVFFMSFILMVALNPAVNKLEKYIKSRALSIAIVYILLLTAVTSFLALLIPPLAHQLTQLLKTVQLPYFQEEISELRFTAQELSQWATDYYGSINALLSVVASTFKSLFHFITLLVISFYLIIDEPNLHKKIGWFTNKERHFEIARKFLDDIEENLGGWVRSEIIVMSIVGFLTYLGLSIIGVPYALPLGLLAFMLEILPNLGPTLAAGPGIIVAWIYGGHVMALIVLGFYIFLQQIEGNFISPKVIKSSADVNALVSILGILSGLKLGGVIGGLLAIPIYILARTVYGYYLQYKTKLRPDW